MRVHSSHALALLESSHDRLVHEHGARILRESTDELDVEALVEVGDSMLGQQFLCKAERSQSLVLLSLEHDLALKLSL